MSNNLFYGIEIARTGIYASQTAYDVIGHNVSNADTEGYTRQRVITTSIEPSSLGTRLASLAGNSIGGGVNTERIDQIRDEFLDREYRRENSDLGQYDTLTEQMSYIESVLDETGDTGISSVLSDFFTALSELSQDPTSSEVRTTVQQDAINLTEAFNHYYEQLTKSQSTFNDDIQTTVDNINSMLDNIASYDKQIFNFELGGDSANDLRDKRNLVLDELSKAIDIDYYTDSDGHLVVTSHGEVLVNHITADKLEVTTNATTGFYDISMEDSGASYEPESGELAAYIRLRDGDTADNMGVPFIINSLNTLAGSLAQEFNTINAAGYTMPDDTNTSVTGVNFFEVPAGGYGDLTAGNFAVSTELMDSANNIACSSKQIALDSTTGSTQSGNNENVLKMLDLADSKTLATVGSYDGYLKSMVASVGIESANCKTRYEGQENVMENLDTRRQSVSSVSIDEEMINMIKTQHAYEASSRVISAIDDALDVLINKTGMVGR